MSDVIKILHTSIAPIKIVVTPLIPNKLIRIGTSLVVQVTTPEGNALVYGEVPLGLVNGVNTLYEIQNAFVPFTTLVYYNGVRQKHGALSDYTEIGFNQLVFNFPPKKGGIMVDYIKR